jgi:hypothetical protein
MTVWFRKYCGTYFGRWFGYIKPAAGGVSAKAKRSLAAMREIRWGEITATLSGKAKIRARLSCEVPITAIARGRGSVRAEVEAIISEAVSAVITHRRFALADVGYVGRYQTDVDEEEALLLSWLMQTDE